MPCVSAIVASRASPRRSPIWTVGSSFRPRPLTHRARTSTAESSPRCPSISSANLRLIHTLRGDTPEFGFFDEVELDEDRFERQLAEDDPCYAALADAARERSSELRPDPTGFRRSYVYAAPAEPNRPKTGAIPLH